MSTEQRRSLAVRKKGKGWAVRWYLCRLRFLIAPLGSLRERAVLLAVRILRKWKEHGARSVATAILDKVNLPELIKHILGKPTEESLGDGSTFRLVLLEYLGIDDEGEISPVQKLHLDFALSTNIRGERVSDLISTYSEILGKRYLDIGCAYGGFLTAFAKRGARQVIGTDISPDLLRLAKFNLEDHGTDGELLHKDILDKSIVELGKFDIVTCNDVIEHVLDPAKSIAHISKLVKSGGLVYFEIPNPFYVPFVREDGHFKLPGITLLSRQDAEQYYLENFKANPGEYSVGFYHSLKYYSYQLQREGFKVNIVNNLSFLWLCDLLHGFDNLIDDLKGRLARVVISPPLEQKIMSRVRILVDVFQDELMQQQAISGHEAKNQARNRILLRYGVAFWQIVAIKNQ